MALDTREALIKEFLKGKAKSYTLMGARTRENGGRATVMVSVFFTFQMDPLMMGFGARASITGKVFT